MTTSKELRRAQVRRTEFLPSSENIHETAAPRIVEGNAQVTSDVDPANDTQINVRAPENYSPAIRGHESTHVAQFVRQDGVVPSQASGEKLATSTNDYDYGGVPGLLQAQQQGKTLANYSQEQQAAMVQDYIQGSRNIEAKAKAGTASPQDLQSYSQLQQAYHPFIKQLAPQPAGNTITTKPEAPGLPSADTPGLGMLSPDKLMGGAAVPIHQTGGGQPIDKATTAQYLKKAGGNVNNARAMAIHDGWKF
jgi:hypothetical protein